MACALSGASSERSTHLTSSEQCLICLTKGAAPSCDHCNAHIHMKCVDKWICENIKKGHDATCPMCRRIIVHGTSTGSKKTAANMPVVAIQYHDDSNFYTSNNSYGYDEEEFFLREHSPIYDAYGDTHADSDLTDMNSREWDYPEEETDEDAYA